MYAGNRGRKNRVGRVLAMKDRQNLIIALRNRRLKRYLSRASSFKKSSRRMLLVSKSRNRRYPLKVITTSCRSLFSRPSLRSHPITSLISRRSPASVRVTGDPSLCRTSPVAMAVAMRKPNRTARPSRSPPPMPWGRTWKTTDSCASTSPSRRYLRR